MDCLVDETPESYPQLHIGAVQLRAVRIAATVKSPV